jgi:transglutaminase-like putative cysteine protease
VVHRTEYHYARPVQPTLHRLMLRPHDSHDLRLREATLTLSPPAGSTRWAHDVFGNSVCYLDWPETRTDELRIVSTLDLEHYPSRTTLPLDPVAETFPFSYAAEEAPDLLRLQERHFPDPERKLDIWARKFLNPKGPTRTMAMLEAITSAIKQDFTYVGREAEGTNEPVRTLATRSGACRDFAVLMIEAVRTLGLAARFVSGYLYDEGLVDSAAPVVGGGATHAWCAVYLPGAGWVEFDPTNGLTAGRNLIRVCVARAPEQAVPVAGGFIGGADDFRRLVVDVTVAVGDAGPIAPPQAEAASVPDDPALAPDAAVV